jgi:beta-phosphoglucomutase-like phosphatase (HAD superfamily)
MSTIKAIIYDVDGTMVNSEPLHVSAWDEALKVSDRNLSDLSQIFRQTMAGKKPIVIARGMVEELNLPISANELLELKSSLFLEKARTSLLGMPGVVASIHRFKEAGYKLAIGTSLDRDFLDIILNILNVSDLFDVIVTGDQIENGKPDPETYLKVSNQLGISPNECVVFEDAQSGIQSAKAASAWCIAIKNKDAISQDTHDADITVSTLNDITLDLLKRFTS